MLLIADFRRDWSRWSKAERLTAKIVAVGIVYLAFVLIAPKAAALPW
jgi:hypothetical protein